eukprot:3401925-Prymnesium_polylepis.1
MMRRASIAAVARHDAFGCVLTRWLGVQPRRRPARRTRLASRKVSISLDLSPLSLSIRDR